MTPYYEHGGITIYHGDCREILPSLPKVDTCLTSPPYREADGAGGVEPVTQLTLDAALDGVEEENP